MPLARTISGPILITGINGFIAGHLAERLMSLGVVVRGLARRPEAAAWLTQQGAEIDAGDLNDVAALQRATTGCSAVVHAAAWTGGPELDAATAWQTNVSGTANVIAAGRAAEVQHLLYISSVAVYGINRTPLIDEDQPTPPVGQLYPESKIAAEAIVCASGLPYVIIRPASTYGPRGMAWTIRPIETIRQGNLVLLGRDTGLVTPGYIDNVVDGICLALSDPAALGQTFNLCDDRAVTFREFYLAYARMLGKTSLPTVPGWSVRFTGVAPARWLRHLLGRPAIGPWSRHFRTNPSQFSVAKAQRVLGYHPRVTFEEGMRRTETWLRATGYLTQ